MPPFIRLSAASILAASGAYAASADIPYGPSHPQSADDCTSAFAPAFSAHFSARTTACKHCDRIPGFPGNRWAATYSQCYDACVEKSKGEFNELKSAKSACYGRVSTFAPTAEQIKLSTQTYDRAYLAYKAISSPKNFLESLVNMPKEMMNIVRNRKSEPLQYQSLESEMFKYSVIQAQAGVDAAQKMRGGSKIISTIQTVALKEITNQYVFAMNDFRGLSQQIDRSMQEANTKATSTSARTSQSAPANISPQCATLRDPARSAALMSEDEDRWNRLTQECTK